MQRRLGWVLLIGILAAVYSTTVKKWLKPPTMEITVTARPPRPGQSIPGITPLVFGLDTEYPVQSIRVLALANTNSPEALPLTKNTQKAKEVWHLQAGSRPVLLRGFPYGEDIEGMISTKDLPHALQLESGESYRVEVVSGRNHGTRYFVAPDSP